MRNNTDNYLLDKLNLALLFTNGECSHQRHQKGIELMGIVT